MQSASTSDLRLKVQCSTAAEYSNHDDHTCLSIDLNGRLNRSSAINDRPAQSSDEDHH
jgi:hypothetical protein